MRKSDLVAAVASTTGLSQRQADEAVSAFVEHVTNALSRGDSLSLVGFGSFSVQHKAARTGRHPQTGEAMQIAASNRVSFKPGKALKDAVNS
jgi:DNA-binding protein HU-beta